MSKEKYLQEGTSGTDYSGGVIFEEYLQALLTTTGADTWDEMRRSDDQVSMLLSVVKNPIMAARWFITPADDSDKQKEISDFITHVLFEDMGTEQHPKTFEKFKREALTCLEFGYSVFEITNKIVFNDPGWGDYVGLKGIDWRSPRTLEEWNIARNGELLSIHQIDSSENGGNFTIGGEFLLHIAPEMEGDNYEGISKLRPIYGNWLRKNMMRKLNMIGIERAATGVPVGRIPIGQENSPSTSKLEDSLARFVNHENQYIIVTEGYSVDSIKITHDAEKVQKAIEAENIGMTKSFLANFMELGISGSGSHALGSDLSDIFLSGIEIYANAVTIAINTKIIPQLVKAKFGRQAKYPKMKIEGINDKAGKEFAEVIKILTDSDLVQIDNRLREMIHKRYNLTDFQADTFKERPVQQIQMSDSFNLAEPKVSTTIKKTGDKLTELMRAGLEERSKKLIKKMLNIFENSPKSQRMAKVNRLSVPGQPEYKKGISEFLATVSVGATDGVVKELGIDDIKLADPTKEEIKNLPPETKATGKSQAELLAATQDADLKKNLYFTFTSNADTLPTTVQMEAQLVKTAMAYAEGGAVAAAGANAIANTINLARNAIYQKKEVLDKIETFIFTNPSPEALVCIELTGRVFTKEEYLMTNKLPPLHHHCNSYIVAQVAGRKGNKELNPIGLQFTGTEKQIEAVNKSIKF